MEDVVISGMSGRLPQADSVEEFAQKLFGGVDLVTEDDARWPPGFMGLPRRMGKLKNLSSFDAAFFSVPPQQADRMDIQMRKLLEVTYETLIDAGINPTELRGSNTGVFVGARMSDCEELWNQNLEKIVGYTQTGCCRAMFSNRISYIFDFKGPSMNINTACSSSLVAMVQAVRAVRTGVCDAAVVAGTNIILRPQDPICFNQLKMLSPSGRCAAFDESASGYVKSEAVVSILIQRRSQARRIYATVRGVGVNTDGYKTQGITYPSGEFQKQLIESTYQDAQLCPKDVSFVETHGTGTKAGDFEEVTSITGAFCKNRSNPLLIGSLKSNMGHSEVAAGLCSIVKVLLSMERNIIPANLHYVRPNPEIPALNDGRIKVVNKNTEWSGGLVSINSFGYGGANAHVILEGGGGSRSLPTEYAIPRLVIASGRTEDAVHTLLTLAAENPKDADLHALLDSVFAKKIPKHTYRGYCLLTATAKKEIFEYDSERPIWFVFSGFRQHWPGSYRTLLLIPSFTKTIDICAEALKPYGVNLHYLLKEAPESDACVFTSFMSITAIQIALVHFLRSIEINPNGIIGHSLGEIGCAYADGALTAKQAILAAYFRIKSVLDCNISGGAMAVVGLTRDECSKRCPRDVQIACHNSKDNVTISGPQESVKSFVKELSSENILAKILETEGVAYHSKHISTAAPLLLKRLQSVITEPKPRSEKWVSSSMRNLTENGRVCDAAYFVNNFLSPVQFEEAMREVPENALLVELAPVASLQAMLKRQKPNAVVVPLLRPDASNSCEHLLSAVGRLYGAGAQPQLTSLYPALIWPVSQGTPGLASRVLWDHSVEREVPKFENSRPSDYSIAAYDISKPDDSFIAGHNIDGRTLFPGTGYLVLVWRTVANLQNSTLEETPIIFKNVQFKRPIVMPSSGRVEFTITILKNSGEFEISEGEGTIVTGNVRLGVSPASRNMSSNSMLKQKNSLPLNADDIYKELRVRGYHYSGIFCGIKTCDIESLSGTLAWNNNWVAFLDTMLQFKIISMETKQLHVITSLRYAFIDPKTHLHALKADDTSPIVVHEEIDAISSPGIELHGVTTRFIPRQTSPQKMPVLETYNFYPYDNTNLVKAMTMQDALNVMMQLITENLEHATNVKIIEFVYRNCSELLLQELSSVFRYFTRHRFDVSVAVDNNKLIQSASLSLENVKILSTKELSCKNEFEIVLACNILTQPMAEDYLKSITFVLSDSGMIMLQEPIGTYKIVTIRDLIEKSNLILVSIQRTADGDLLLLRRRLVVPTDSVIIDVKDDTFDWIEPLRKALKAAENGSRRVYAVTRSNRSGIIGFAKALRTETIGRALRIYFLPNATKPLSMYSPCYSDQIQKDLFINVLHNETWGSYRHFVMSDSELLSMQTDSVYVKILNTGDLSSLRWTQNNLYETNDDKICQVHFASLNFHDIMLATGKLYEESDYKNYDDQDCQLGLEYSGVMQNGKRVMGIVPGRSLSTAVRVSPDFLWEVPDEWSLEEAATVPVAYGTAYYALVVRGRMRRGESVLVHAGSGGVGQAAIAVALHAGCTVYTTVGTADKRAFLLERFPGLSADNIGNSRDTSFEQLVRRRTRGRGVDLVLNSLAGDQLMASLRCLAPGGRFLEIGRFDITENTSLGMAVFFKNTTFHGIMLKDLIGADADVENKAVAQLVRDGVASGAVTPLEREVFNSQQVEQAFRYMAAGKHIGKVMIRFREENEPLLKVTAMPEVLIRPDKFYIIINGLGGFGLELAHWLAARGARNLVLNSRRGACTGYQTWSIQRLRSKGVRVIVDTRDCACETAARSLLREVTEIAPVCAIFNLAAVLKDGAFENQTTEYFQMVSRPKINDNEEERTKVKMDFFQIAKFLNCLGCIDCTHIKIQSPVTNSLDVASRELTPELDYFVVFSSATSGRGNYGQSNYALANSAMERIVENRRKDNLPGLAIQWGFIGDVGLAQDFSKDDGRIAGTAAQGIASCLDTLGKLLTQPNPVVTSWVLPPQQGIASPKRHDIVPAISNILGLTKKFSKTATFEELGIDSLVGAEVKRTLERQYNIILEINEIYSLTFEKLEEMVSGDPEETGQTLENVPMYGEEELVPKDIIVRLPSEEVGSAVRPVFMVHSIEGVAGRLREIASSTRAPVFGLQCAAAVPSTSLADVARCYVQQMRAKARPPYVLLGYSYGAAIAFEMMYQLEQEGCECRLICVDGSPKYVKSVIQHERLSARSSSSACQARMLAYFTLLLNKSEATKVAGCIRSAYNWEERVDATVDLLKNKTPFPAEEIKMAANRFREMVRMLDDYDCSKRVQGPVTLVTASQNRVTIDDDYGLREMCSGPAARRQLQATHQSIVTGDCACAIADCVNEIVHSLS